jgi:hypothetical protein
MHSVLSILFGFVLTALVYGLSFLPCANLSESEETEASASRIDQESTKALSQNPEAVSRGSRVRRNDAS